MNDDLNRAKPDIPKGIPKKFVCVIWGVSIEFHGVTSGVFLKYVNPIKIDRSSKYSKWSYIVNNIFLGWVKFR